MSEEGLRNRNVALRRENERLRKENQKLRSSTINSGGYDLQAKWLDDAKYLACQILIPCILVLGAFFGGLIGLDIKTRLLGLGFACGLWGVKMPQLNKK